LNGEALCPLHPIARNGYWTASSRAISLGLTESLEKLRRQCIMGPRKFPVNFLLLLLCFECENKTITSFLKIQHLNKSAPATMNRSPKSSSGSASDVFRVDEKSRKIKVGVMWYNNHVKESIHDMHYVTIVEPVKLEPVKLEPVKLEPVKLEPTKTVSPPPRAEPKYELIPFPAELLLDLHKPVYL